MQLVGAVSLATTTQQTRVCFSSFFFCLHPFSFIFPLKESNGCPWLLRGPQVVFCSDNTLPPPPLFFCSWLIKNCRYFFFTNGVLNLVLGYRIFCLCTIFLLFLHTLVSFFALFGERFSVLSPLYSRTLRLSYVEP